MKFTLKDYQEDAVKDVLSHLKKAARRWCEEKDKNAFSLTATTGAGKTVMAAAVFEALFHGSDDFDFEPDRSATVIWFSDDPALNEQSRSRLLEASDRLSTSDLQVVSNSFDDEKFEAGKIYFLNTQKLSKNSLLVRGHSPDDAGIETVGGRTAKPDSRAITIWDTIRDTIEDPDLTLYLVLDEAHRGMGTNGQSEKPTIVKRLINGFGSIPGIPVVLGVSATVERFNAAMADGEDRTILPPVIVDNAKVQASGLLKDVIVLDAVKDVGKYDTVLVRRGTKKLKEISLAWEEYAKQQGKANKVFPLMVLQVPNTPDHGEIGRLLDVICERWPELQPDAFANVFGEHTTQKFGNHLVSYVSPECVQGWEWIRVLIAKDAISTGWDCPRAEVMVSFRPANDRTHIAQLLGRMVRTPLAQRIPGNQRLNAVDCLLPFFNPQSLSEVVDALMSGEGDEPLPGRRVLINPEEMKPNPSIPEEVWNKLLSLSSQSLPRRQAKPVKRLTYLAQELSADGIIDNAGKVAHSKMHKVLNAARELYGEQIEEARKRVLTVEGTSLRTDMQASKMSFDDFIEAADNVVIDDAYRRAAQIISPDLAKTYCEFLARTEIPSGYCEEGLIEARVIVASLGLAPEVKDYLEQEAEKFARRWLNQKRVEIRSLSDERQEAFRQIHEMSSDPMDVPLAKPVFWMQRTAVREVDGTERPLPRFDKHLLCADDGTFPADFNSWEGEVLEVEMKRGDLVAWYRNPPHASRESLGIVYEEGPTPKIMRPDFIFFARLSNGMIVADIVDPHGTQLSDSLPKLKGLARYAETHGEVFRRIDAVAKNDGSFKVLDLKSDKIRSAVHDATLARDLFESDAATDYTP